MSKSPNYLPHPRPYYPWMVWLLSCIFLFYIYCVQSATLSIRPVKPPEEMTFHHVWRFINPYAYCIIIFQIPVAILIDKMGARRMTSLGIVIFGLGSVFFGFAKVDWQLWAAAFILGFGWVTAFVNALKLAFNWFVPKQFAFVAGLTLSIAALGIAVGQPIASVLLHYLGWRQMMVDFGIIGILYALIFFSLVRDSEPGARYSVHQYENHVPLVKAIGHVFSKGQNWVVAIFYALFSAPWLTYLGLWHASFFEVAYNVSKQAGIILNVTYASLFAIACPFFAYLSTRYQNRKRFLYIGVVSTLIFSTLTIYIPGLPYPLAAMFSMITAFSSGVIALSFPLIIERNIPIVAATVFGFAYTLHFILKILFDNSVHSLIQSVLPEGTTHPTVQGFQLGFLMIPTAIFLSLIILFFVKETHAKQTYEG
ncbi:MAG: MFS transporter [Chlamydiia bacterium]|nr:MFS transporter [Chlamydiia bacterium]